MRSAIIIFVGAGLGGIARHFFNATILSIFGMAFPWGIISINVLGSIVMGVIVEWLALIANAPLTFGYSS